MIYQRVKRNLPILFRFGIVGTFGAGINFLVYFAATKYANWGMNLASVGAFSIAVANNYIINHRWTFRMGCADRGPNVWQFSYYLAGNLVGLLINLVVLNFVVMVAGIHMHLIGQALGILAGMLSNFIFAKKFVFSKGAGATKVV